MINIIKFITVNLYYCVHRMQPKNMILAGVWVASEKPPMQLFLKPIVEMLSSLETQGLIRRN